MVACFCNRLVFCFDGYKTINGGVGMAKCPFNKYKECQESDSRYCYCTLPCDVYNNYKNKIIEI